MGSVCPPLAPAYATVRSSSGLTSIPKSLASLQKPAKHQAAKGQCHRSTMVR